MSTTAIRHRDDTRDHLFRSPEQPIARKLDFRTSDCIDVRLLWNRLTDSLSIAVDDRRAGRSFRFGIDPADALRAFHHPYVFAPTTREQRLPSREGK